MHQVQQKSPPAAPQQPQHPQSANEYDDLQDYDLTPPLPTCLPTTGAARAAPTYLNRKTPRRGRAPRTGFFFPQGLVEVSRTACRLLQNL